MDIRITCTCTHQGSINQNVLHFINTDGALTLEQCTIDIRDNWLAKAVLHQGNDTRWININAQNLDNPLAAPFSLVTDLPGANSAADRCPSFVCFVFKLSTLTGGRHGRGRIFMPGVHQDNFVNNVITSGNLLQWQNDFIAPVMARYGPDHTSPLRLCVRANMPDGPVLNPVIAMQLRTILGVQRRRNTGVGI